MKAKQAPKKSTIKESALILLTAFMIGISNSWNDKTDMAKDVRKKIRYEVPDKEKENIKHPNLLWNPAYYIRSLFDRGIHLN